MKRGLLLTGEPGAGKTALIKEALARIEIRSGGFYTEEIRVRGVRQGFQIVTLDGQKAILAHVNISSPYRVSKYGVDIDALNTVGVSALRRALEARDLVVIDEIGKMELLSPQFREVVTEVLNSSPKILGTIMFNPHPFADQIKCHPEVKVLPLTRHNRTEVIHKVLDWLSFHLE